MGNHGMGVGVGDGGGDRVGTGVCTGWGQECAMGGDRSVQWVIVGVGNRSPPAQGPAIALLCSWSHGHFPAGFEGTPLLTDVN
jgi:hypothetical protein